MRLPPAIAWACSVLAALLCGLYLFPVYWMYVSGFKTGTEIFARPPTLVPREPTLAAFAWILTRDDVGRYLWNSTVIAGGTTALTLALGTVGAWGLARLRSRWIDVALVVILVVQVLPPALLATPMFVIFRQLGLIGTQAAVILADTTRTLPFALIVLRTTFLMIPRELEEAARVDGCTRLGAFARVVLPAARGGVIVAGTLAFIMAWGDLVYALSFVPTKALQPATVGLYSFVGAEYADWNNVMAFASLFVTPVIVAFLLLQRRIVGGLTAGAVK
jgi:multiple sugar transport system permease protein